VDGDQEQIKNILEKKSILRATELNNKQEGTSDERQIG